MTQHITQEKAKQIAAQFAEDATYEFNIANAAIQHYINQRVKELPVLPEPVELNPAANSVHGYTADQFQAYALAWGDHRAAHARELVDALEMIVSTHQGHCEHHVGVSKHSYNLADIAEEALSKYKGAK